MEAALAHMINNKGEAAYRHTNYLERRRGLVDAQAAYTASVPTKINLAELMQD